MSRGDARQGVADPNSRARTHLASERTFLAWLRTGATLVALGLAAAQFLTRETILDVPVTRGIAISLVAGGVLLTFVGEQRYRRGYDRIEAMRFEPATRSVVVATAMMLLVGLLAVVFIVLARH